MDRGVLVCSVETVLCFGESCFRFGFDVLCLGGPGYRFGWWGPKYSLLSPRHKPLTTVWTCEAKKPRWPKNIIIFLQSLILFLFTFVYLFTFVFSLFELYTIEFSH